MQLMKCDMEKKYVFISYSSRDRELVWKDVEEFQRRGYNVWLDEMNLDKTKSSWKDDAIEAIKDMCCKLVVFYVSKNSLMSAACLNEMLATTDKEAQMYHGGNSVPFIAVDTESIGNLVEFRENTTEEITNQGDLTKDQKKEQIKTLYEFIEKFFNSNNERVRIKDKNEKNRFHDYYEEIMSYFPEDTKIYSGKKAETPVKMQKPKVETPAPEVKEIARDSFSMPVGKIAQTELVALLASGTISEEMIEKFQTKEASKQLFDLNFPLLLQIDSPQDTKKGVDASGVNRYYTKPIGIYGKWYLLTSQWYDRSKEKLVQWIKEETKVAPVPQRNNTGTGCKITIGTVRGMFSEPPVAKSFRAVREGMPRGGKGAMDYVMAAVLGGCNSITEKSCQYQINYYIYDVASEDESKKKNDGKLGATWTWSSNCRKVIDIPGAGQIPKEINQFFESLPEETTLGALEESFLLGNEEAFRTKKNDIVVYALQQLIEFAEKNV